MTTNKTINTKQGVTDILANSKNGKIRFIMIGLLLVIAVIAIVPSSICRGEDISVNMQTLDPQAVAERYPTDEGGRYPSEWVTTPLEPVVVRQNHPEDPTYQEAQGYTFLLCDLGFPRLVRMPDGTLVLRAQQGLHLASEWGWAKPVNVKMFSYDDGESWSDPLEDTVDDPARGQLVPLGGQELMLYGQTCHFSKDGGKTWDESIDVPAPEGDFQWVNKGTILVEGDTITTLQAIWRVPSSTAYPIKAVLHRSYDRGRTWEQRIDVLQWSVGEVPPGGRPAEGAPGEASIIRAQNGDLVAALRTNPWPDYPWLSDHWCGIATSRSTDNGKTWSELEMLYKYGYHHQELLLLENGDILLTYAARIGELDGHTYHGIEAMLSHDNGKTWDWENKFILFRWPNCEAMHSPISAQLSDGRILTVFMHPADAGRYWNDGPGPTGIGHTSVVIWSPE